MKLTIKIKLNTTKRGYKHELIIEKKGEQQGVEDRLFKCNSNRILKQCWLTQHALLIFTLICKYVVIAQEVVRKLRVIF